MIYSTGGKQGRERLTQKHLTRLLLWFQVMTRSMIAEVLRVTFRTTQKVSRCRTMQS